MNKADFRTRGRLQRRKADRNFDKGIQYSLSSEEHLLQSISSRLPLPKVLNEICSLLDCQIGKVVSLISLPGEDAGEHGAVAMNAALFGLHTFCSERLVGENEEPLGFLEMYCCVARSPNSSEFQLIEWAKCLAVIAIKRHNESTEQVNCGMRGTLPLRGRLLEWPVSMN